MFVTKSDLTALEHRLRRVEALLDAIATHLEISDEEIAGSATTRLSEEVEDLLAQGKKIEAIKCVRDEQGLDLAAAKRLVDEISADARRRRFSPR